MPAPVPVAEIVRSGFVEGRHYGSVVALEADGSVAWSVGDPVSPILPRSCNKPLQAVAMVEHGLGAELPPRLLALAAASHSGEPFHLDGVRELLALGGLDECALQCPPDWPLADDVRDAVLRAGGDRTRVAMNCSGKHAAMLLTCQANGWPIDCYLDPDHPLQVAIATRFAELTGEPVAATAVDGCGAPLLATSLTGLARAFQRLALAESGAPRLVADAMRSHPAYVSGSTRDELRLLTALPGAIGKAGAEAVYAVALADGRAIALKIDDGAMRARPVVMAAALRRLGIDSAEVAATGAHVLTGGGQPVGEIRAAL